MSAFKKSFVLCCALALSVFAASASILLISASQAQAATSGPFSYEVSGGRATITGYTESNPPKQLTIPSSLGGHPVVAIGYEAFCTYELRSKEIDTLTIPNSVTSIGAYAFYGCQAKSLVLPSSLLTIGERAFCNCERLKSITIPNSVRSIDVRAFECCYGATAITIPKSVKFIGAEAFSACDSVKDVYYGGNESEWDLLYFNLNPMDLPNATFHYNSANSFTAGKTAIEKLVRGKKGFTVKWRRLPASKASGYQIRYSTKSNMKPSKTIKIKSWKKTSTSIKNLKAGKKYYVQVRSYKTLKGKTHYSSWTPRKSVITKR